MKKIRSLFAFAVVLVAIPTALQAQPRPIEIPELNSQFTSSGVENLRVGNMSPDGTEALLLMEYTYNGNAGPNALVVPVIENRKQHGVSKWFGSDHVIVPRGRGPISIKVKYFNDEPGAPATLTTDSIRILIMNSTGNAIVGGSTELKTIHWGKEGMQPVRKIAENNSDQKPKLADLAAEAEIRAREKAQRAAEAEEQAKREAAAREAARTKAEAEAKAAAEARAKVEADAKAREAARIEAEKQAAAEAQAREEARIKAEQESQRLERERKAAEARAQQEAEAKEKARLEAEAKKREEEQKAAEAEAARLAEERRKAEAQAAEEAKAREAARLKDEAEAKRLEAERKAAEERVRAEEEAQRQAAERVTAEAKARADAEAQAAEAARIKIEQEAKQKAEQDAATKAAQAAGKSRTHITNIDVVNRSLDRSQMTFGIEFDRRDRFRYMGINVEHSSNPVTESYFDCQPKEVGRQKYALVKVAYAKPLAAASSIVTDRLEIYGCDSPDGQDTIPLHTATMLLVWRAPGASSTSTADATPATPQGSIEITDFRQRSATSGYASVTYNLPEGTGQLRVRLKNSTQPESANWFAIEPVAVKAGQGLELIPVTVSTDNSTPTGPLSVDTIEAELVDASGKVIGHSAKSTSITWNRNE